MVREMWNDRDPARPRCSPTSPAIGGATSSSGSRTRRSARTTSAMVQSSGPHARTPVVLHGRSGRRAGRRRRGRLARPGLSAGSRNRRACMGSRAQSLGVARSAGDRRRNRPRRLIGRTAGGHRSLIGQARVGEQATDSILRSLTLTSERGDRRPRWGGGRPRRVHRRSGRDAYLRGVADGAEPAAPPRRVLRGRLVARRRADPGRSGAAIPDGARVHR